MEAPQVIVNRGSLAFALAVAAAALMVAISEGAYWQSARTLHRLQAMAQAPADLQTLQSSLLDAAPVEQRAAAASVPTQDGRQTRARIDLALAALDAFYRDRPDALPDLAALHAQVAVRLSPASGAAERDHAMVEVRELSGRLLQGEAAGVGQARRDLARSLTMGRAGVASLSLLCLLALGLYLRQGVVLKRQQQAVQSLLRAERDRLEVEVEQRTGQLVLLAQHLETAREDERGRLARDLHDELGALLTSAKLDAARIKARLAGSAADVLERLAHLVTMLNAGIALKRRIIEDLRPSALGALGLAATLEILGREFATQSGVEVICDLEPVELSPEGDLVVYRLVQEAMTNIAKYAQAQRVWISMTENERGAEIAVRDDGQGFDPSLPARSAYGLVGMRFRVQAANGSLHVDSTPGKGTCIRAQLPAVRLATAAVPG